MALSYFFPPVFQIFPFLPVSLVNGLQARTFGIWTLLSSIIRCACAIDIQNRTLYHITLWTFVLALGHFLSEAFIYKTAPLTIGVMAPLIVASFSIMGMLIGFQCIPETQEEVGARQKKRNWIPAVKIFFQSTEPTSSVTTRHTRNWSQCASSCLGRTWDLDLN